MSKKITKKNNEKKIKISQKEINYVLIGLSIIATFAFVFYVYLPNNREIKTKKDELLSKRLSYVSQLKKISGKQSLESELSVWKENEIILSGFNIENMSPERALFVVEKYLRDNFIRIDKLEIRNDINNVRPEYIVYDLEVAGDYNSIKMFIREMESLLNSIKFDDIYIRYEEGEIKVSTMVVFERN